jgi:hypothetical protein
MVRISSGAVMDAKRTAATGKTFLPIDPNPGIDEELKALRRFGK